MKIFLCERTIQQTKSCFLNIPEMYCRLVGLKKGMKVSLFIQKDGSLIVCRSDKKKLNIGEVKRKNRRKIDFSDPGFALGVLGFKERSKKALNEEV